MKSGAILVASIALTSDMNSHECPRQSFIPTGLPSANSRRSFTNRMSSIGVENTLWHAGEMPSQPIGTPRAREISSLIFAAGSTPPCPGFTPWLSFISIILI